jgi:uncharacterized membrane protein YeaQ/YmgE (transglycosylase-associated protein family)
MYLSGESLLIILLVGLIAGWLAGKIVSGSGFGFIGDIAVGIVGSLIGTWLLSRLGIHLGGDFLTKIVVATIGAVLLLLVVGIVRGGGGREGAIGGFDLCLCVRSGRRRMGGVNYAWASGPICAPLT